MKYVYPIRHPVPGSPVAEIYAQMKQDFGAVGEPFSLHACIPELLAGAWSIVRETTIVGQVHWSLKEAVVTAISYTNSCPYCMTVHASLTSSTNVGSLADLITQNRTAQINDPFLRSCVVWALSSRSARTVMPLPPHLTTWESAEILGTAVAYHYINRMVNVFLPENLLSPILPRSWVRKQILQQVGRWLARGRKQLKHTGASLHLLPDASLPAELSWAATAPNISRAFAGWAAVIEQKGAEVLSPEVRTLVMDTLTSWYGEPLALGKVWREDSGSELTGADQAAAKLALLTALASYQVDEQTIQAFRAYYPTDAQLVGAVAWASAAAARAVASWLTPSFTQDRRQLASDYNGPIK
jgi:hypothetical protein